MDSRDVKSNHSLVDALAQLDIGGQSRGVINKLPNEMLRAILGRVQAHHLIRLRSVDKRWKVTIEDICRDKKCLMIVDFWNRDYLSHLSRRLDGHFKLSENFVVIQVKSEIALPGKLCTFLAKLFPHIEQFFDQVGFEYYSAEFSSMLKQWSATLNTLSFWYGNIDTHICAQINELVNLKKLDMEIELSDGATKQIAPTLARLEHFSGSKDLAAKALLYFGSEMKSFAIYYNYLTMDEMTKWRDQCSSPVSSLVRLGLSTHDPQVLPFICEHFSSLQMLRIALYDLNLTTEMIGQLARLDHLAELQIEGIIIDWSIMATLDVAKLASLHSIRAFSLVNFKFYIGQDPYMYYRDLPRNSGIHHFCRVLSIIFPNVEKLILKSRLYEELGNLLEAHVNLFANLRSHDFDLDDPFERLIELFDE